MPREANTQQQEYPAVNRIRKSYFCKYLTIASTQKHPSTHEPLNEYYPGWGCPPNPDVLKNLESCPEYAERCESAHNEDSLMSQCRNTTITDLANELLNETASYLSREDLTAFRAVGNHSIRNGTDYIFRQIHFRNRLCSMNDASITRLYNIVGSRFTESIRYITIGVDLECQVIMEDGLGVEALRRTMEPQLETKLCLDGMSWKLKAIFKHTANLKGLSIYAPTTYYPLNDDNVSYTYDTWFQDLSSVVIRPTGWDGPFETHFCLHVPSTRAVYSRILAAVVRSKLHLEDFRMLGFTQSRWKTRLGPVQPMFEALAEQPGVRNLTHLELEFDLFADTNNSTIPCIVDLIAQNKHLQNLKICTSGRARDGSWHLLLDALAYQPPFKLRQLYLTGAVANRSTTLDKVINAHATTLRHVVLNEIIFDYPNSLRDFFRALSDTKVEYFGTRHFWRPHHRTFLTSRNYIFQERDDEALEWHDADANGLDASYRGWVDVGWDTVPHTRWVIWYDGRGTREENWMGSRMRVLLESLDASRIRD